MLLAERPRHGYELKRAFEQRTGQVWTINTGQVYTTLERLQRDGLIEPGSSGNSDPHEPGFAIDRRQPYRLTDEGQREAEAWLADHTGDQPPRDELLMKVLLATQTRIDGAQAVIDSQRHRLLGRLQELRRRQRDEIPSLATQMSNDALVVRIEADLRWLDLCEERLRAAASGTATTTRATKSEKEGTQ